MSIVSVKKYKYNTLSQSLISYEIFLCVMTVSLFLFEYGEICGNRIRAFPTSKSIVFYFSDIWNVFDTFGGILLLVWTALRLDGTKHFDEFKGCLASASIFYSLNLLRYLSLYEPVGKLTLMVS